MFRSSGRGYWVGVDSRWEMRGEFLFVNHYMWYFDCSRCCRCSVNRRVSEEVLLYLVRLLEDLELDASTAGLKPGQLWGCTTVSSAEGSSTSSTGSNSSRCASRINSGVKLQLSIHASSTKRAQTQCIFAHVIRYSIFSIFRDRV